MHEPQLKVLEFMKQAGQHIPKKPFFPRLETQTLRIRLIKEEIYELEEALYDCNMIEVIDALCDLLYVIYGAACAFGIDLEACFNEVHRSNMTKKKDNKREDGKVLKDKDFVAPNLKRIVDAGHAKIEV